MTVLWVALGALAGAPLRLLADRVATARRGRGSVLGTLAVNVLGSAVLGVLLGRSDVSPAVLALVGTGFCGTLTTFSTFGWDVVRLVEERAVLRALGYVTASLLLGLGAAAAGFLLSR
ncbi:MULTISPECIES: fluoride efflux transporter FluC [unclassified Modestobacter]|uniref:fluoride efflux transporter FluC n=1 Tax=unclassified Modestobacter TaxID=2643866 RepID=UPI0022AB08D8|nr:MULTISPECIES: CrcB family protein [unclassified Modestobacter]MCZ2823081.1 CrcB family protein [Modestobacter sp. VKM Ac-2981]MCZ2851327.1 CrcB family protein [Modestobacter sp. VKM Ac-2982]